MKSPRDYYPPEYLAEVVAEEKLHADRAAFHRQERRRSRFRAPRFTVQRLPSGCLLYQLHMKRLDEQRTQEGANASGGAAS